MTKFICESVSVKFTLCLYIYVRAGMRTGQLQTMVGLITILRGYEVSQNKNYKNELSKRAIFTAPADGVHIYVKKSPVS